MSSVRLNANSLAFISNDSDKSVEIICTDNNFNSKWTAKVDGYYQNSALLGNNLIVVVSTEFTFFTRANSTFKAYLLNFQDGKVIKQKVIFEGNNAYLTVPYFIESHDHKTYTMAVRETAVKRTVKIAPGGLAAIYLIKRINDQHHKIKAFNVITLDENLEQTEILSPDLPAGQFIGVQRTLNNELYTAVSENKKGITISRYLVGKDTPVKSVTEPYSVKSGLLGDNYLNDQIKFLSDTINNHTVYITGAFKNGDDFIMIFNKYDFEKDDHKRFQKRYTNKEVKEIERSYTAVNKKFRNLTLAPPRALELIDVVINDAGYFLVVSDFREETYDIMSKTPPLKLSEGIIVYNLDKNMAVKAISTIPRSYAGIMPSSIKTYQKDSKLYILASDDDEARFSLSTIQSATGKVEDIGLISPVKAGRSDYPSLQNAVVSDNRIILPVLDYKAFAIGKLKFDVNMYMFGW